MGAAVDAPAPDEMGPAERGAAAGPPRRSRAQRAAPPDSGAPDDTVALDAGAASLDAPLGTGGAQEAPQRPARLLAAPTPAPVSAGRATAPVAPVVVDARALLADPPAPARRRPTGRASSPPPAPTSAAPRPGPAAAATARPGAPAHLPPGAISVPTRQQRRAAQRLVARKVGRLVRHVDPWSVFKVSLLFNLCLFVVLLVAGTVLWALLRTSGLLGGIEGFIEEAFALRAFAFDGTQVFQLATFGGLALVLVATLVCCLAALVFNLISDLVGGIRVTVVEEETARPVPARRP